MKSKKNNDKGCGSSNNKQQHPGDTVRAGAAKECPFSKPRVKY
jgi:hypothetical protein